VNIPYPYPTFADPDEALTQPVRAAVFDQAAASAPPRAGQTMSDLTLRLDEATLRRRSESFGAYRLIVDAHLAARDGWTVVGDIPGDVNAYLGYSIASPQGVQLEQPTAAKPILQWLQPTASIGGLFDELATRWIQETEFESSPSQIFFHEAYLQIIGLGPPVIPFLLARLASEPERWVGALRVVTRETADVGATSPGEAIDAWAKWAMARGYTGV
jgi:hypothetical protein